MIKELIEKRITDHMQNTKSILGVYEEKLVRALRFFMKMDRDIQINSVYLFPKNPHFIVNVCKIMLSIGDKVKMADETYLTVTAENQHQMPTNELQVILPAKLLEEGTPVQIYEQINIIDEFVGRHGLEVFKKVVASGITHLDDILKEENEVLLEEITNPITDILKSLDELQQIQYHIFLDDKDRRIH